MVSLFQETINNYASEFTAVGNYRTITRKSGSEIITITNGKITITNLNYAVADKSKYPTITLDVELSFDPIDIVMNNSEQLICVYDHRNCWILSLNKEASYIDFTVTYKFNLDLADDVSILQILFNNISRYESEIVMLTTADIRTYCVDISLEKPLQVYNFEQIGQDLDTHNYDSAIVDPVSITFATSPSNPSCETDSKDFEKVIDPQNDLTLLLLTSDASLYKIYPFFPAHISVSDEWKSTLFDYASLKYNTNENEIEKAKLLPTVKISANLFDKTSQYSVDVSFFLKEYYKKSKIIGPLVIDQFPEDFYEFEAIKLLTMPNDIIVIVFNQALAIYTINLDATMIFQGQGYDSLDNLMLLDSIIFDSKTGRVCTADVDPVHQDSIVLVSSNSSVLQIDFSKWIRALSAGIINGDLSDFEKLYADEKLPTSIINLGKTDLSKEESIFNFSIREQEKRLWFSWNNREVFIMFLKQGDMDTLTVASLADKEPLENDLSEDIKSNKNKGYEPYKSLLVGKFEKNMLPDINMSISKITEVIKYMSNFPNVILNENNTTAEELESVHKLTELIRSGQLLLYRVLALLSKRLKMMTLEYRNQLNAYHKTISKITKNIDVFFRLDQIFLDVCDRQKELKLRLLKAMADCEILESSKHLESISISKQETLYFKELERMRDYLLKKETEIDEFKNLLEDIKGADKSLITENKAKILENYDNKKSLEHLKGSLLSQQTFFEYLTKRLNEIQIKERE